MAANSDESIHPVDAHVGARIRLQRRLRKMSQETLGEALGVTFQQLQKYERGVNRVSASKLWMIAQTLGVPVSSFFDGLDGASAGHADNQRVVTFLQSEDGAQFAEALAGVDDRRIRHQMLNLLRTLAGQDRPRLVK